MVYKSKAGTLTPTLDAGLGLVYRLNILWSKVDNRAITGDLDGWNFVLNRVFCNLLYREKIELSIDDSGKVTNIKMDEEAMKIYIRFNEQIKIIKRHKLIALKKKIPRDFEIWHEKHYHTLIMKDIWLRKFMAQLGLYLKESAFDPSKALFGGS